LRSRARLSGIRMPPRLLDVRKVPHQLEPLAFAAGKGVDWLAELQVAEPGGNQPAQALFRAPRRGRPLESREKVHRFVNGGVQQVGNGVFPRDERGCAICSRSGNGHLDLENVLPVPFSIALRALDINIAQKLHLDLFEPRAAAALALALAGIEAERAGIEPPRSRRFRGGEEVADIIKCADINRRV